MIGAGTSIAFAPLVPWWLLAALAGAAAALLLFGIYRRARGILYRALAAALIWAILANPSLVDEMREPLPDIAVVVVDESPSQRLEPRLQLNAQALAAVREQLRGLDNLEVRTVRVGLDRRDDGTLLFGPLERALAEVPRKRLAGIVAITDGQIHDAPDAGSNPSGGTSGGPGGGPVHFLLTGRKNERDRRLVVESAPSYGLLGKPLTMTIRLDDNAAQPGGNAVIRIKRDARPWRQITVEPNVSVPVEILLDHRGQTFFELEVGPGRSELTMENNRKVVTINGIRDRLRVLLISGEPHPGQRAWRNILKSDPGVDLVHFTILRPPEKRDMTPVNELALISFPVRELFQEKLDQFHLIIFDRYRRRGVIRAHFLQNIADYVRQGGALMVAAGPAYAGPLSLAHTAIGPLLPGRPTGEVYRRGFRAKRTDQGKRHPVTSRLSGAGVGPEPWGRWFRQIDADGQRGHILLSGLDDRPLLILDRAGKGRVAQLLSDQAWLWDRGFEGGGPQSEMLRRVSHWLMKEPELEEEYLLARIRERRLEVLRRSLKPVNRAARVTTPGGRTLSARLKDRGDGTATGSIPVETPGLYRVADGKLNTMVAIGSLNPREMSDVRTSDRHARRTVLARGGSIVWLAETGVPDIRRVAPKRRVSGAGGVSGRWIGLRRNDDYVVTGIREIPLLAGFLALLLALLPMLFGWRRESQ
ncbi:MAG: hypothetical protein OXM58_01470 [Rhodospirillaceae bacterium]|nr:hypothetical protein [Rhodospirillaceae bacterium]MDE0617834.1 hypothetical protein [Rhodospirillaceae bacterium]